MKKYIISLAAVLLSAASYAVTLEGSTTVLPLAQKAAEVYMDANPKADISIRGGGSGVGITSLIAGTVDVANSSRPIKPEEIAKAESKKVSPKATVVAMDAISVIINPANKVATLIKRR